MFRPSRSILVTLPASGDRLSGSDLGALQIVQFSYQQPPDPALNVQVILAIPYGSDSGEIGAAWTVEPIDNGIIAWGDFTSKGG